MKISTALAPRQYISIFLMAIMLLISFFSGVEIRKNEAINNTSISEYELKTQDILSNLEFAQNNSFKNNLVRVLVFSKVIKSLVEKITIILNEFYFFPYPETLTVNSFSRNVFYVFISTKAP